MSLICPQCGRRPTYAVTNPFNRAGHGNRPYYYCEAGHASFWICWADHQGIENGNPRCHCNQLTRWNVSRNRTGWYECAWKQCEFKQNPRNGGGQGMPAPVWQPQAQLPSTPSFISQALDVSPVSTRQPATPRRTIFVNPDCSVHGEGRTHLFSRNKCKC